jgi:hypothetical protein
VKGERGKVKRDRIKFENGIDGLGGVVYNWGRNEPHL